MTVSNTELAIYRYGDTLMLEAPCTWETLGSSLIKVLVSGVPGIDGLFVWVDVEVRRGIRRNLFGSRKSAGGCVFPRGR